MALSNGITQPVVGYGQKNATKVVFNAAAVATTGLTLNAQTVLVRVPAGFTVTGMSVASTDMDTGTTLVFAVGDALSNTRLASGLNIGQAGGISHVALLATGFGYRFPTDTDVILTATTAATGATAGTFTIALYGSLD